MNKTTQRYVYWLLTFAVTSPQDAIEYTLTQACYKHRIKDHSTNLTTASSHSPSSVFLARQRLPKHRALYINNTFKEITLLTTDLHYNCSSINSFITCTHENVPKHDKNCIGVHTTESRDECSTKSPPFK